MHWKSLIRRRADFASDAACRAMGIRICFCRFAVAFVVQPAQRSGRGRLHWRRGVEDAFQVPILRCNEDAALACAVLAVGMLCSSPPQPSLPYFLEPLTCISEDDVHQAQRVHYTPLSSPSRCAEKCELQPFQRSSPCLSSLVICMWLLPCPTFHLPSLWQHPCLCEVLPLHVLF
jgi:hypothetical protein